MSDNTTNKDILSGKGLQPLNTSTQGSASSGLTVESREQIQPGFRLDIFSLDEKNKQD